LVTVVMSVVPLSLWFSILLMEMLENIPAATS
jgi:hypothetical protein